MQSLRKHGSLPFKVVVLHGGPGAPGEMQPVAQELLKNFGVLEPLLISHTIQDQVQELKEMIEHDGNPPVILVGWSWGAWLGVIFTTQYQELVGKLVLIGSGPFEEKYASKIMETRMARLNVKDRAEVLSLLRILDDTKIEDIDEDETLVRFGKLMSKADSYNCIISVDDVITFNYQTFQAIWSQASELRRSGGLLDLVKEISCPVVAIHGDYDPHPYLGVKEPLSKINKDFNFYLLEHCGHKPWNEVEAKEKFYEILKREIRV
jgi:pimeloyl-ACP methyl ester carboxylesterase